MQEMIIAQSYLGNKKMEKGKGRKENYCAK
jgi:hypothetical protein